MAIQFQENHYLCEISLPCFLVLPLDTQQESWFQRQQHHYYLMDLSKQMTSMKFADYFQKELKISNKLQHQVLFLPNILVPDPFSDHIPLSLFTYPTEDFVDISFGDEPKEQMYMFVIMS